MIYIFWSFQSSTHAPYIFNMYTYWLTLMCCWISNCDTQQKITHPRASWARSGFEPVLCYTTLHPQCPQQYESFFLRNLFTLLHVTSFWEKLLKTRRWMSGKKKCPGSFLFLYRRSQTFLFILLLQHLCSLEQDGWMTTALLAQGW